MQKMRVGDDRYDRSIAFDASSGAGGDRGSRTTVTIGVEATREQEAELLDICCELQTPQYRPFATKSSDLELATVPLDRIVERFSGRIAVGVHHGPPRELSNVEAVHSALLYDTLRPFESEVVTLCDGEKRRVELLGCALQALGVESTPAVACQRSEFYYPHSYLADLLAGVIRATLDDSESPPEDAFREVPVTSRDESKGRFSMAYNAVAGGRYQWQKSSYDERRAETTSERVECWFDGRFGTSTGERPDTDSVRPVTGWLESEGYDSAADRLL